MIGKAKAAGAPVGVYFIGVVSESKAWSTPYSMGS